jgi:hypothetical protein
MTAGVLNLCHWRMEFERRRTINVGKEKKGCRSIKDEALKLLPTHSANSFHCLLDMREAGTGWV